jgi:hypothetical protein
MVQYTISIVVEDIPAHGLLLLLLLFGGNAIKYDVFLNGGGQLLTHLEPLHEKYGMCLYILSE